MIKTGSPRFKAIGKTRYTWEQEAIDFVRSSLPDQDPYRVYALFELVLADGTISEIDLLVLAPAGLFLVEIKSFSGAVRGDGNYWTRTFEGREISLENPRLLANTKAKRLKTRLARTKAFGREVPFIEALVFLSAPNLDAHGLDEAGRYGVAAPWVTCWPPSTCSKRSSPAPPRPCSIPPRPPKETFSAPSRS